MKRGFTLIELLLVLAILGGLAAIILPTVVGWGKNSKQTAAEGNVHTIRVAVESYYLDKSVLPYDDNCENKDADSSGIPDWIEDLAAADNTILTNIKKDPWNTNYYFDTNNESPRKWFIVLSRGPDKKAGYQGDKDNDALKDGALTVGSGEEIDTDKSDDDIYDTNARVPAQ
ncbi:MAG: hypothetical protein DRP63_02860 [Planctomycetota bacterium]|nr:MAG: hypothetical protein DRP63_02860 [Planctomycetota bacterium]